MRQLFRPHAAFILSGVALALSGCAATGDNTNASPYLDKAEEAVEALAKNTEASRRQERPSVEMVGTFYADRSAQSREEGDWLKDVKFTLGVGDGQGDLSLRQIMQVFARSGVNMTNALDVSGYYYNGTSLVDTNAKSALRVILGNMGLDYTVDDENKVVTVNAMPRKSYYLSLNNRSTEYASGSSGAIAGSEDEDDADAGDETQLGITANNDFWASLEEEMVSRCNILVPSYGDPILPTGGGAAEYGGDDQLVSQLQSSLGNSGVSRGELEEMEEEAVCLTSINRNTGTVTVHGPRWVQDDMESYFERLNETLNTRITLEAKIIVFATNEQETAGLDLSAFTGNIQDTGLAVSNNVLGGITLGANNNMATISGAGASANAFIGAKISGAQAFIGWLETQGRVSIENEPIITTVSGVPTTFKRTSPIVYFRYNQEQASLEGGGVSSSINTEEVIREVGSILNINPTYDLDRNVVRAQIGVNQRYLVGYAENVSYLATGNDIQEIPVRVPLIESIVLNGELLLRDGETIIVGGQKFVQADTTESGITNLRENSILGGLFGRSEAKNEVLTYYTILTVNVDSSPNEAAVRL